MLAEYAVDFAHMLRGLDLPGKFEPIRLLCCAVKRSLSRPGVKKRPVTKDEVACMIDFAVPDFSDIDLMGVRAALFAVLAFCLEARYDDLCDLRLSSFSIMVIILWCLLSTGRLTSTERGNLSLYLTVVRKEVLVHSSELFCLYLALDLESQVFIFSGGLAMVLSVESI